MLSADCFFSRCRFLLVLAHPAQLVQNTFAFAAGICSLARRCSAGLWRNTSLLREFRSASLRSDLHFIPAGFTFACCSGAALATAVSSIASQRFGARVLPFRLSGFRIGNVEQIGQIIGV